MDIKIAKKLFTELSGVGIKELIIEPTDAGGTRFRGASEDRSIIVFYEFETEQFVDMPVGIKELDAVLSRINLFDEEKASIELTAGDEGYCVDLTIKQSRQRATYRCHEPNISNKQALRVPSHIPGDFGLTEENTISFDKDYVAHLNRAISALSQTGDKLKRNIKLDLDGENLTIKVSDGKTDSFNQVKEEIGITGEMEGLFDVQSFGRVMRRSSDSPTNEGSCLFTITDRGVGVFALEYMDILLHPTVS